VPRLFVTDVDEVLSGDEESNEQFRRLIQRRRKNVLLVYATGRTKTSLRHFLNERELLPRADYHIASLGTEIYRQPEDSRVWGWDRVIRPNWRRDAIVQHLFAHHPEVKWQQEINQSNYKVSFWWEKGNSKLARKLEMELRENKLSCRTVFSSPGYLDIIPEPAGKAQSVLWLIKSLMILPSDVIVLAQNGNDLEFLESGLHVIVRPEAQGELLAAAKNRAHLTQARGIDGISEGLRALNFFLPTTGTRSLVDEAFEQALVAIRKNLTPIGFSAASLADLKVDGTTAENYRSVWARDGMMTMIWTLELNDADIRNCGRQTLITLLDNQSPSGLVPTNVRIDTGEVEYSGLGGIASIDSGLWVIIGAFRYYEVTGDVELLKKYESQLQKTMNWLSAQDVNNCGLLEIPELGDWADLIGRSYNVLYDEVLWYRALCCYTGILQTFGKKEKADDYAKWAKHVKERIIQSFWPTGDASKSKDGFVGEVQHNIGSSSYLLAQITPFSFNWRCDVYGNLLAYLYGILDEVHGEKLLGFLWGVGVNNPWPVKCLYPPIHVGSPDWKDYLIVNMLNLPDHYHNGGIWPFIGGLWVRFLHRLGKLELAQHELIRLAELNKLGRNREWEFNEWAHGQTGRPMGMAYQAWSAASYIRAYLEIHRDPQLSVGAD